jgi:hypothetical protein
MVAVLTLADEEDAVDLIHLDELDVYSLATSGRKATRCSWPGRWVGVPVLRRVRARRLGEM